MSRSGYDEGECAHLDLYRNAVDRAIRGKRGQAFLRELAAAMDAMSVKSLIAGELVAANEGVCAIGAVCKARGLNVATVDAYDPESVGRAVGIAWSMAAEIAYVNDEMTWNCPNDTGEERWKRVRAWVNEQFIKP